MNPWPDSFRDATVAKSLLPFTPDVPLAVSTLSPTRCRPRRSPSAWRGRAVLMGLVSLFLSACQQNPVAEATPEERMVAGVILNASRADSLAGWEGRAVGREPILAYTLRRTAVLLPPSVTMTRHDTKNGRYLRFEAKSGGVRRDNFFAASAVAVTRDGYFLTAAHCLDEGACTIVAVTKNGSLQAFPARVVWCGHNEKGGPDIGLVHAPVTPSGIFSLTDSPGDPAGTAVFTGGFGAHTLPEIRASASGGHIVHTGRQRQLPSGARWRAIFHDAPITPGDSGGPVLDAQGRLLGINTEVRGQWDIHDRVIALTNYTGVAVAPDAAWIQNLITRDRAASG